MRILVGTLYSGENEFEECVASIRRQTYTDHDHFVVEGLPKREAHDTLYGRFMSRASEFDLFVKVDADMVIENVDLFALIVARFHNSPDMDMLSIEVYDFFTDRQIDGMHIFRSCVRWPARENDVFTDRHPVPYERRVIDSTELAPAAIHCKNPSWFQAFHFGLHRAVKIRECLKVHGLAGTYLKFHLDNRELLWRHFLKDGDRRIGIAALATELTLRGQFEVDHIAYTNPFAEESFRRNYADWPVDRIRRMTKLLRLRNMFMPEMVRYRLAAAQSRYGSRTAVASQANL